MNPLLLASNRPPNQEETGPRVDFLEIAGRLKADIAYPPAKSNGLFSRIEEKTASDWRQAWTVSRRRGVSVYVSLSEKVGLPLAFLGKRPHVMIGHYLTSERKRRLQQKTNYLKRFDRIIVVCQVQERYLLDEIGLPPERVRRIYNYVDSRFWIPSSGAPEEPYVVSVGKERRDYVTLVEAARRLPEVRFVVVASSPWSRRTETPGTDQVPPNVTFRQGLAWTELRDLYNRATIAVVPLEARTEYAAGVTGVLEAMSMAKPLIVSDTPGIADHVEPDKTVLTVPAANPEALASTIAGLLGDAAERERLGRNARQVIDEGRNLDTYIASITHIVETTIE